MKLTPTIPPPRPPASSSSPTAPWTTRMRWRPRSRRAGGGAPARAGDRLPPNRALVRTVARFGRGTCAFVDRIEHVAEATDAFVDRLERPALTDLALSGAARPRSTYAPGRSPTSTWGRRWRSPPSLAGHAPRRADSAQGGIAGRHRGPPLPGPRRDRPGRDALGAGGGAGRSTARHPPRDGGGRPQGGGRAGDVVLDRHPHVLRRRRRRRARRASPRDDPARAGHPGGDASPRRDRWTPAPPAASLLAVAGLGAWIASRGLRRLPAAASCAPRRSSSGRRPGCGAKRPSPRSSSSTRSSGPWPTAAPGLPGRGPTSTRSRACGSRVRAWTSRSSPEPRAPRWPSGWGRPGTGTGRVLAGHRDTWAAFLQDLRVGGPGGSRSCGRKAGLPRRRRPRGGTRCHRGALPHRRGSADPRHLLAVLGAGAGTDARARHLCTAEALGGQHHLLAAVLLLQEHVIGTRRVVVGSRWVITNVGSMSPFSIRRSSGFR